MVMPGGRLALCRRAPTSGQFPTHLSGAALTWLAEKDQLSRERSDAAQASQARTALIAKQAAIVAAIAAIVANVIAIIGIVITCLAWLWPRG
jgi:hypothetical protein